MLIISLTKANILWVKTVRNRYLFPPQPSVCHSSEKKRPQQDSSFTVRWNCNKTQLTESPMPAAGVVIEKTPFRPLFTQEMSPENIVIQPFAPLSGHEYSHNPLASIPEAPAFRCWVFGGW